MTQVGSNDGRTVGRLPSRVSFPLSIYVRVWGRVCVWIVVGRRELLRDVSVSMWRSLNGRFPFNPIGIDVSIVVAFLKCGYRMLIAGPPASYCLLQVLRPAPNSVGISSQLSEQSCLSLGSAAPIFFSHNPSVITVVSAVVLRHFDCGA